MPHLFTHKHMNNSIMENKINLITIYHKYYFSCITIRRFIVKINK
jgi:hypothetical protein